MNIPTVQVLVTVHTQSGEPDAGAVISATLDRAEIHEGHLLPRTAQAVADQEGQAVLELWPNELGVGSSCYLVEILGRDGAVQRYRATVPNADCKLWEIIDLERFPPKHWSNKADRVVGAVEGTLALLDARGNLAPSGLTPTDIAGGGVVMEHNALAGRDAVDAHPQYLLRTAGLAEFDTPEAKALARANLELQTIDGGTF